MSSLCFNFREVCAAAVTQRGRVARQAVARYSSTLCKSKPKKKGPYLVTSERIHSGYTD